MNPGTRRISSAVSQIGWVCRSRGRRPIRFFSMTTRSSAMTYRYLKLRRSRTWVMVILCTLNSLATSATVYPSSKRARISRTSNGPNFVCGSLKPLALRPLLHMSSVLSCTSPRNRWAGFMQRLLSQVCRTHRPSGIAPRSISQASRWARTERLPLRAYPYPVCRSVPVHKMQPSTGMECASM